MGCCGLTKLEIPPSVTAIRNSAFRDCSGLTSITIPESVTSIGESSFLLCESLMSVTIPQGVTSIGHWAFYGCPNLTIHAPAGSYAEQYARENNIPFVAERTKGDEYHDLSQMRNRNGQLALPRMRFPCDKVLQEEATKAALPFYNLYDRYLIDMGGEE